MLLIGATLCGPTSASERHQLTVDSGDRRATAVELFGDDHPVVPVTDFDGRNGRLTIGHAVIAGPHAGACHVTNRTVGFDAERLGGDRRHVAFPFCASASAITVVIGVNETAYSPPSTSRWRAAACESIWKGIVSFTDPWPALPLRRRLLKSICGFATVTRSNRIIMCAVPSILETPFAAKGRAAGL